MWEKVTLVRLRNLIFSKFLAILLWGIFAPQPLCGQPVLPTLRRPFVANAPDSVRLGKLWWDVGLFHPFTGSVSRKAWEDAYFITLTESAKAPFDFRSALARALGTLRDPATLLALNGEGAGDHYLPVIFEVRQDGVWIVGGLTPAKLFGTIQMVDDQPR